MSETSPARDGELSVVAPFRYTGLLWALVLGYIIWRHVPSLLAWAGILLLLSAGMMLLREQRRLTRRTGNRTHEAAPEPPA